MNWWTVVNIVNINIGHAFKIGATQQIVWWVNQVVTFDWSNLISIIHQSIDAGQYEIGGCLFEMQPMKLKNKCVNSKYLELLRTTTIYTMLDVH